MLKVGLKLTQELAQTPEKLFPICSHVPLLSAKILSQNWLGKTISCDGSLRMKDLAEWNIWWIIEV